MGEILETPALIEKIMISEGHDFRGRHGLGRMNYDVVSKESVSCVAGRGIEGDRYFDFKEHFKGQITFFSKRILDELSEKFGEIDPAALRRNIIVSGMDLEALVGRKFSLQGLVFEGSEECKPCYWMDQAVGAGAEDFLKGNCRGGLRARILSSGELRVSVP
ncbi:MOSC domain-containing protein [Luteolibacter algae]